MVSQALVFGITLPSRTQGHSVVVRYFAQDRRVANYQS